MNKGDVTLIAQVLASMNDATRKLDEAYEKRDGERVELMKKELMKLGKTFEGLL